MGIKKINYYFVVTIKLCNIVIYYISFMNKDEVIRVRVEPKLKEEIKKKSGGKMSSYLRCLAVMDLAKKEEE